MTSRHTSATIATPRIVRLLGADCRMPANDGDLTEADLAAIDAEFAADRANGSVQAEQDQRALSLQVAAQHRAEWQVRK